MTKGIEMNKVKNRILLVGDNSKEDCINYIKKNSKLYNWENKISMPKKILCRVENENIFVIIPWSREQKEFRGRIYEKEMKTYIEGAFYPLKMHWYFTLFFMSFLFVSLLVSLSWMTSAEGIRTILMLIGSSILYCAFCLRIFYRRDKKYESRIVAFLNNSLFIK